MYCLRGKENLEYFLSLLLADLMKRVVANVSCASFPIWIQPRPSNLAAMSWPIKLDLIFSPFCSGHRHRPSTSSLILFHAPSISLSGV
jgi:hypothetical protein